MLIFHVRGLQGLSLHKCFSFSWSTQDGIYGPQEFGVNSLGGYTLSFGYKNSTQCLQLGFSYNRCLSSPLDNSDVVNRKIKLSLGGEQLHKLTSAQPIGFLAGWQPVYSVGDKGIKV